MSIPRTLVLLFTTPVLFAQVAPEQFELIKKQGFENSQVMAHLDHLVNRIGPRLTSSDNLTVAVEWARDTFRGSASRTRASSSGVSSRSASTAVRGGAA
jgi:hypothetical protein